MKDILIAENVVKKFGENNEITALKGVSFSIPKGDFLTVMGPSGSGKSTLLNIMATLDVPTSGKVYLDGRYIEAMGNQELSSYRRNKISFIFQSYNLLNTLTMRENIIMPLSICELPREEIDKRVLEVATRLNVVDILDKYPVECSGGQRQRVAACRALAPSPKIIVADEPTGALDTENAHELLQILTELNEEDGITILLVTHDPMIASYAKRVMFIKDGEISDEIVKGDDEMEDFYNKIVKISAGQFKNFFKRKKGIA